MTAPEPAEHAAATARTFTDAFGREPEGVWAAPGRVTVIGEHTDYTDGYVLPVALPHRTCAAVARRDDDVVELVSAQHPGQVVSTTLDAIGPGAPAGWAGYAAGVLWALRRGTGATPGHETGGVCIAVDGRVPIGAGLSSSAALECAVALAVRDLAGLPLGRTELVDAARAAENDVVGAPTGMMDQSAALLCEAGHALFLDTRDRSTTQVPLDLAAAGLTLLVLDTGAAHQLTDGQYGDRRGELARATEALGVRALRDVPGVDALADLLARDPVLGRRARHVVTENARVLAVVDVLRSGRDPRLVGPTLTAGHASLRDDLEISTPALDTVVDAAVAAGAHGARMVGGGFGGSAVALVETAAVRRVTGAVAAAARAAGHEVPRAFLAVPSDGARRVA
ncbi:galactokinase [Rhodococcus aerolatus]